MIIETIEQALANLALARAEIDRLRAEVAQVDRVSHSDANSFQTEIDRLRAEVLRLKERLEIGYQFDSEGSRVECEDDGYDGIFCRDQTIKLQDEEIDRLRADKEKFRRALNQISANSSSGSYIKTIADAALGVKEGE